MSDNLAFQELVESKKWVETITGKNCYSFCYPQGKFNQNTPELVRKAGFIGARSCMFNLLDKPQNQFLWGLSTHAHSHSVRIQLQHALIEKISWGHIILCPYFNLKKLACTCSVRAESCP